MHALYVNPLVLLSVVKENGFTLESPRLDVYGGENGHGRYYDFGGAVSEMSGSFLYRIYSPSFAERVRRKALALPIDPPDDCKQLAPVLNPCKQCGNTGMRIRKLYEPFMYTVVCRCGRWGKVGDSEDNAVFAWNDNLFE